MGLAVGQEALARSYALTFVILLAVMGTTCVHFYRNRPWRRGGCAQWGPFAMMVSSTVLLLLAPLKNLVTHACMESFRLHGYSALIGRALDIMYTPMFSTRVLQAYTAVAYVLMFWASAMQVDMFSKLQLVLAPYLTCTDRERECQEGE